ncbi:hydrogenase maturation protease [Hydrogenivirga caldilitoris]|uniref:Hydrogenase maturation protease n=1 Tax=Hydrogenivirga caldilitoris TaxID=246264 RepID=A0A497XRR1_9AQUI|nr:HyaD/HybD family hydrogenase maturation endopeptidase [Hydrogenivirga caldilitoris]RLJ70779.1 hydrogenase maturation protease [Hydrogenivirga caldilitoris]
MITVLGIGNILLSDEGLGVRALERLGELYEFPEEVRLMDGGTLGIDLLYHLEGVSKLLVLDAVSGGKPPGTLYVIKGEEVKSYFRRKVSMHEIGFQEVLALMEVMGKPIPEIVVMGIEPKSFELSTELTPEVEEKIPELIERALEQLKEWGVEVKEKEVLGEA